MKKVLMAALSLLSLCSTQAQTLFTYGNKPVTVNSFLRAFEKNPAGNNSRRQALTDYLPLFINYKLKVQDAYDQRLDTLPSQQEEWYNYREQLVESFVAKTSGMEDLLQEALKRVAEDRHISHLGFSFSPGDANSKQQAAALARQVAGQLARGLPFEEAVKRHATDADEQARGGEVGWITLFSLPYVYETAIYKLAPGQTSQPIAGSDAFHVFKVNKVRPAAGQRKLAQILIFNGENPTPASIAAGKKTADSVYQLLQAGLSFEQAALQYSADRSSYAVGGVLPPMGVGTYDASFENAVFALQKTGEVSAPFLTSYGWHLVKLLEKIPAISPDNEEAVANLRQQLQSSDRAELARQAAIERKYALLKLKEMPVNKAALWRYTDSALRNGSTAGMTVQNNTLLFAIGPEKTLAENWVMYNRAVGNWRSADYEKRYRDYQLQSATTYYRQHLEKLEPAFADQLQEFKDANMLFAAMEKEVWAKAANDSAGLHRFYLEHKSKYVWGDGALALVVTATDSLSAVRFGQALAKDASQWRQYMEQWKETIVADSGRFEASQLPGTAWPPVAGSATALQKNELDGSFSFTHILAARPGGDIRSFEEARGYALSDYQQLLETRWVERLRRKYPVQVNQAAWQALLK
jgi:peptidyl-prolyl cis-trans isomerase SurA